MFRLVGYKQIWSFDFPVLLSFDSTKMKLLIYGVASWTGLITPVVSIFSVSCMKVCLRWTGMGLQGICLGVMDRFVWIWYGSPGNWSMPSKSSGYCSLICSFDLMILIFFGVSSWGIMGSEVVIMDSEFEFGWTSFMPCCCCVDVDCACMSFLGYSAALDMRFALGESTQAGVLYLEIVIERLPLITGGHCLLPLQCSSLLLQVVLCLCLTCNSCKHVNHYQWGWLNVLSILQYQYHSLLIWMYEHH